MVSAHDPHFFPRIEPSFRLAVNIVVQLRRRFVDAPQAALHQFGLGTAAALQVRHHAQRLLPQPRSARLKGIVHLEGADPALPSAGIVYIIKVYLHRRIEDRIGCGSRPAAIRRRDLPRHGQQHELSLFRRERQSEITTVVDARSIRIEIRNHIFFHISIRLCYLFLFSCIGFTGHGARLFPHGKLTGTPVRTSRAGKSPGTAE